MSPFAATNLSDRELVDRILAGERSAFTILVRATEALVAKIICNLISDAEDRRDLAQDVYLKVYRKLDTFAFQAKLSTWIGQIAYHTAVNHMRKKQLVFPENFDSLPVIDESHGPDILAMQSHLSQLVKEKMEVLPPLYRMLLSLYHQQELSYSEMIAITGMPEGTIKNYLFRARKALKKQVLSSYTKESL